MSQGNNITERKLSVTPYTGTFTGLDRSYEKSVLPQAKFLHHWHPKAEFQQQMLLGALEFMPLPKPKVTTRYFPYSCIKNRPTISELAALQLYINPTNLRIFIDFLETIHVGKNGHQPPTIIGVASYRALGHMPPSTSS